MPLPGDSSAAIGHRYEGRWTARAIVEVLREDAQAIRLQPPGPEGEGIEFYLQYSDRTVFHQVKRQRTSQGDWTIAALVRAGVLTAFAKHLANPSAHCTFASAHSAASLEELSEKARSASSWAEYKRDFLVSRQSRAEYAALKTFWILDDAAMFAFLRRVQVATVGEDPLRRWVTVEAEAVIAGDQSKILATLVEIALNNVNRYLPPQELWDQLAKYDYKPSMWRRPQQAAIHVGAANRKYIASRRATLIRGELVVRAEAEQLAASLTSHRLVLLDGIAGMGKSDLLLHLIEQLESNNTPYLAFRLDRTMPTRLPEELGRELGLPTSPHATLAAVAQGRNAVLIIDQLDAVSATSGRNPQFLECIDEIVRSAHALPHMRIVLVCRTFDMQNDARLRQLVELEKRYALVTVGPFARDQLIGLLTRMGYAPGALSDTQIELLRVPLHLALLTGGTTTTDRQISFSTPLDLFDAFWRQKRRETDQRLAGSSWIQIIERLVDHMSDQQALRAPAVIVDAWESYADAMVSAHVLTRDGPHLAFFHESFFDYAFARTFIGRRGSIRSLLAQDQFLFRRGQIRQILAHERLSSDNQYTQHLAYLFGDQSVRFHLKDITISWLAQVSPTADEWAILEPLLLDDTSPLFSRAWRTLAAIDWFEFADACGFARKRLQAENKSTEWMVSILAAVGKLAPQRVGELLSQFADNPSWRDRIGSVISQSDIGASRGLFDLLLKWVDCWTEMVPTESSAAVFAHTASELAKSRPDWCCELLGHFLENRISTALKAGLNTPFDECARLIPPDLHLELFLSNLGEKAPMAFIDHVWPTMLSIVETTSTESRVGSLRFDSTWRHRHYGGTRDHEDGLLSAAEAAYRHVARSDAERFEQLLNQHRDTDLHTIIHLLYEAFRADPARLANAGIEFVLADLRRLRIGCAQDEHWTTRSLLESLTPFASIAALSRLEAVLLTYYPDTRWGHGVAQFTLLGGIASSRRSSAVQKRVAEFQRKFGKQDASPPEGIILRVVRSPIPNDAALKMSDKQWLRAISKHSHGYRDRDHTRDFLAGSAEELARVLEAETKRDSTRFARLGVLLPNESNDAYFDALLRGVADAAEQPDITTIRALLEKCHRLPNQPCGLGITRVLPKLAASAIPSELLDIVSWYALNDPDPPSNYGDEGAGPLDLMNRGLNSVRGGVAAAIAELVEANPAHRMRLEGAIRSLVADRVTAVRAMAAQIVCALATTAPATAQTLFLTLVSDPDDRLLTTRYVYYYMLWQGTDDFDMLRPIIEHMIRSTLPEVRKLGAAHMNLAALSREEARDAADACLNSSDEALRMGAAMVFKSNLTTKEHAARCSAALGQLFNDPSADIRAMAGSAIWRLKNTQLQDHVQLARAFMKSAAFAANSDDLIHGLKESTAAAPELILETCEATLAAFDAHRVGPIAYQASEAISLVLRAYADSRDRATKDRALDLIDRALLLDIFGASKILSEHDRWLGNH